MAFSVGRLWAARRPEGSLQSGSAAWEWILFLVIAIGGNWLIQFALPENARWIMVNGAFPAYLAACMLIRSACYLVCRFAPGRFRLPPEQTSEAEE